MINAKVELSIVIVTMNRKDQLNDALCSCIECELPINTEFIIVDNGSTDGTKEAVQSFFKHRQYVLNYIYLEENAGISRGRNIGKNASNGEILYYMDDDSIIPEECKNVFFTSSIKMFHENSNIGTLTNRVYDKTLMKWRESKKSKIFSNKYPSIYVFHGNSYFIRKKIEKIDYLESMVYAYEDVYLSLLILDQGFYNALNEDVYTLHIPKKNKWIKDSKEIKEIYVRANASMYTVKYVLFPSVFKPFLFISFLLRCFKTSKNNRDVFRKSYELFLYQKESAEKSSISFKTIKRIWMEFGLRALL